MTPSKSGYIDLESVPLRALFQRETGSVAFYVPAQDDSGSVKASIVRISSAAKSYAVRNDKRCLVQTVLLLENDEDSELPSPSKLVKVTVRDKDDISASGERYLTANSKTDKAM